MDYAVSVEVKVYVRLADNEAPDGLIEKAESDVIDALRGQDMTASVAGVGAEPATAEEIETAEILSDPFTMDAIAEGEES